MSPKEEDRPRQKKWATKTKTGCLTCRSRRIKCDESKPACRKCASTGRICEGYPPQKSKSDTTTKSLAALVPRSASQVKVPTVRDLAYSSGPPGITTSPEGRFIMHFFRREACPNIGGAIDKKFWSVDLQQATDTHPIMWYSSSAFAALYLRRNEKRYTSFKVATNAILETFALSQYNQAIRCAIEMASQPHLLTLDQKQAFLMSSLIFTGIGYLNGNTAEALTHLRNGLRLFKMWRFDKLINEDLGSQTLLSVKSLVMLFRRFSTQSLHLRDESWPETKWTEQSLGDSNNDSFATPTDAYFSIEPIYNRLVTLFGEKRFPSTRNPEQQPVRDAAYDIRTDFDAWKVRFADLHRSKDLDAIDQEGVLILRIRQAVIEAALSINLTEYNIALDKIDVHFRTILSDAEDLLELQLNSRRTGETFTFSASVCEALSFIGTSCRVPELREQAVALLRKWPLMDGAYDAGLLGRVVEAYGDAYGRIEDEDSNTSHLGSDDNGHAIAWIQPHSQNRAYRMHSELPVRHWLTGFDGDE